MLPRFLLYHMQTGIILVSACLLGEYTRYDGGTKEFTQLFQYADKSFGFAPVCPEVACGLPVPREPMNLYLKEGCIYLKGIDSGRDFSPLMQKYLAEYAISLQKIPVCGFVLKARSPSCGIGDTPIYAAGTDEILHRDSGLFARYLLECYPRLPLISDEDYLIKEKRQKFWAKAREMQKRKN